MVMQWIDQVAGLAYMCVRGSVTSAEFLNGINRLIRDPNWRARMPILEDLREFRGALDWLEDWRTYVSDHAHALEGCRWAFVSRGDDSPLASALDTAAHSATAAGVNLKQFTSTVDAHAWLSQASATMVLAIVACA
jgi:hypothetical protein